MSATVSQTHGIDELMRRAGDVDEPSPVLSESIALGIEIGRLLERGELLEHAARHCHEITRDGSVPCSWESASADERERCLSMACRWLGCGLEGKE